MTTHTCPTCGAPVEFRFDDSFVRICSACNSAVLRGDRGVETLGRVADLVPSQSPLELFAEGKVGSSTFLLVGMAQLRHGAGGIWQEWYAKLDGGQWAWLSEAQGRFYWTVKREPMLVRTFETLEPGVRVTLDGHEFTVGEVDEAAYASARGEIPYRLDPTETFRFADLADGQGGFATIDYGSPGDEPVVYIGQQVSLADLGLWGGEDAPPAAGTVQGRALACPNCGGALELRVPDQTLRIGCPYCSHLVSVAGTGLEVIAKLSKKATSRIPLGTVVTFSEGPLTVVGYLQRSAFLDNMWWPFEEYLLYEPKVGFRWLVQSDGHWSYVQPVANGAVSVAPVKYEGVELEHYQHADLRVDEVLGELYWQVTEGERVRADDYIAPPAMLSSETTKTEQTWSLSTYVSEKELRQALGNVSIHWPPKTGVAPNQPYPLHGVGKVALLSFGLLFAVAIAHCSAADNAHRMRETMTLGTAPTAGAMPSTWRPPVTSTGDPEIDRILAQAQADIDQRLGTPPPTAAAIESPPTVSFSAPFALVDGQNIAIDVATSLDNSWAYVAIDLVNETTGHVVSFDKNLERYSGYSDGEYWSEGSTSAREVLAPMPAGQYVVRVEGQHGGTGTLAIAVSVRQDVFRPQWLWFAFFVLAIPFALIAFHALRFKKKRWENSNVRPSSSGGDDE